MGAYLPVTKGCPGAAVRVDGLGGKHDHHKHEACLEHRIQQPARQRPGPEVEILGPCLVQACTAVLTELCVLTCLGDSKTQMGALLLSG